MFGFETGLSAEICALSSRMNTLMQSEFKVNTNPFQLGTDLRLISRLLV